MIDWEIECELMNSIIKFPDSLNVETVNELQPATKFLVMNNIEKGFIKLTNGSLKDVKLSDKDNVFREFLSTTNKEDRTSIYLMAQLFTELSEYFILTIELVKKINFYVDKYEELIVRLKKD